MLSKYTWLRGRKLQLRPNQEKFGSKHPQLEVCALASCLPAYLDRQVILMMDYNGVSQEVSLAWSFCKSVSRAALFDTLHVR